MRKYEDGGELTERMPEGDLPNAPKTFGEAFKNARADGKKTFTWRGKDYSTAMASSSKTDTGDETARMKARAPAPSAQRDPSIPRPVGEAGPEPTPPSRSSRLASGMSDTAQKALAATTGLAALGGAAYKGYKMATAAERARAAEEAARATRAAPVLRRSGESMEAARAAARESMMREPPMSRAASAAEKKSSMMQAEKAKPSPRARTRETEDIEFRKGGAVRSRGDGICQRGHTKGRYI
jgi:hypothetical protein